MKTLGWSPGSQPYRIYVCGEYPQFGVKRELFWDPHLLQGPNACLAFPILALISLPAPSSVLMILAKLCYGFNVFTLRNIELLTLLLTFSILVFRTLIFIPNLLATNLSFSVSPAPSFVLEVLNTQHQQNPNPLVVQWGSTKFQFSQ